MGQVLKIKYLKEIVLYQVRMFGVFFYIRFFKVLK